MPPQSESQSSTPAGEPRLWFGFAAGAFAWVALFIADLLLAWKTCTELPNGFDVVSLDWAPYLFGALTVLLLAVAIGAGLTSFKTFRRLSTPADLLTTEAPGRPEFMALGGMFISLAMGISIIWLGLPLIILNICTRAR